MGGKKIKRTRLQPIRTVTAGNTEYVECAAQITVSIKILPVKQLSLYQRLARKATQLRLLDLPVKEIAIRLNVGKGTVENALKWESLPARQGGRLCTGYSIIIHQNTP